MSSSTNTTVGRSTGMLPAGWACVVLDDVLEDAQPGFASGRHNSTGSGVVHTRPMNVSRDGNLDFSEVKFVEDDSTRRLRRGDVLFNNTNSPALVGKTAFVNTDKELAFSNHMTRLRPDLSRLMAKFLASQLHAMWLGGFFEAICSNHVNQASVSTKRLKSVEINLPALDEQAKIVEILGEQFSRLDAALASVRAVREKASRFRRSLLHAAFTGALSGHDMPAGELPEGWREQKLGQHIEIIMGQAPPGDTCNKDGVGTPFVKVGEFGISRPFIREWTTKPLRIAKESDVLLCVVGATCGKVNRGTNCAIGRSVAALRPVNTLSSEFLYQFMFLKTMEMRASSRGSAQGVISKTDLSELLLPIPPINEQEKIVGILEEQLSRLDGSLMVADEIERKASALRRSLLHAAFTGELTKEWREGAHV